jgi:hypothetical protein
MIKYLPVPIYKTNVIFVIEPTEQEWEEFYLGDTEFLKRTDYESVLDDIREPDNGDGTTTKTENGSYVVYIRDRKSRGDIAHEIFHAANWILVDRQVTHDESGEAWAYLIGWFTDEIYEAID